MPSPPPCSMDNIKTNRLWTCWTTCTNTLTTASTPTTCGRWRPSATPTSSPRGCRIREAAPSEWRMPVVSTPQELAELQCRSTSSPRGARQRKKRLSLEFLVGTGKLSLIGSFFTGDYPSAYHWPFVSKFVVWNAIPGMDTFSLIGLPPSISLLIPWLIPYLAYLKQVLYPELKPQAPPFVPT